MSTAAAEVPVDSSEQEQADQAGSTRRRIAQPSLGRGERARKVDLILGPYAYTARCPKLIVWSDMAGLIEDQRQASRRERRRAGDTEPAESTRVTTDRIRLTQAVTHFLRGCLSSVDWADVEADLADPDNDLDVPDLWGAGMRMIVEFRPDMEAMARKIGMKIPEAVDQLAAQIDAESGELRDGGDQAPARPVKKAAAKKATGGRRGGRQG